MKENYTEKIERFFIRSILALLEEKGINYSEFAVRVWPDVPKKTAVGRFRLMRNATDGKYQNITLAAASRMAETLGAEVSFLVAVAKSDAVRSLEKS
jgi:hypothetical protein